jgi:hypothetical protein
MLRSSELRDRIKECFNVIDLKGAEFKKMSFSRKAFGAICKKLERFVDLYDKKSKCSYTMKKRSRLKQKRKANKNKAVDLSLNLKFWADANKLELKTEFQFDT